MRKKSRGLLREAEVREIIEQGIRKRHQARPVVHHVAMVYSAPNLRLSAQSFQARVKIVCIKLARGSEIKLTRSVLH